MLNQLRTRTEKTHAIPSLHRDSLVARQLAGTKTGGRMAASGNTYCPYLLTVRFHAISAQNRARDLNDTVIVNQKIINNEKNSFTDFNCDNLD